MYLLRFLVCFGDSVINHVLGRAAATAAIQRRRRVLPGRPAVRTTSAQPPRQTFLLPPSTGPVWIQWISGTLLPTSTNVLPSSEYSSWHFHFRSDVFSKVLLIKRKFKTYDCDEIRGKNMRRICLYVFKDTFLL